MARTARPAFSPPRTASTPLPVSLDSTTPLRAPAGHSGFPEALRGTQGNLPSPPSSPPLAALTSANELALQRKPSSRSSSGKKRGGRGAAYTIRGECERLFCGTLKAAFLGEEGGRASRVSIGMGSTSNGDHSPPSESGYNPYFDSKPPVDAWIEVWDYAGGCSYRGFVGGDGNKKSLFAFFDSSVIHQDLKQGLMALIELADTVFAVSQVVICLDRSIAEADRAAFIKGLSWIGFDLITFDLWTGTLDSISDKWLAMGMEI